jgi:hypothetical protein
VRTTYLAALLVAAAVAASGCGSTSQAAASCVKLSVAYSPTRVQPGQTFEDDLRLQNCASVQEQIAVKVRADGPCSFPHPPSATYTLKASQGVDQHATLVAPRCPGRYTVVARAYVGGSILATSRASFVVEKPQTIKLQPGSYQFQLGDQVNVGDQIVCVTASGEGAGGGVVPTIGHGVASSDGFSVYVSSSGSVKVTCPANPGNA